MNYLSSELTQEYPFTPKFFKLKSGANMAYLDEGSTAQHDSHEILLALHGNPTWSFYYRNVIKALKTSHRIIVPDHIGHGHSDCPKKYAYTLKQHIDDVEELMLDLHSKGVKKIHLLVHDWGGAIGMGLAVRHPEMIGKIILLNTAAFCSNHIPWRIALCKVPVLGEWIVRALNGFAYPATFMAATKKLSKEVKAGYLAPYPNYASRISIARFVQDIPLNKYHPSYRDLVAIEKKLPLLTGDKLILWGGKDFCFNQKFLDRWHEIYPDARIIKYPHSGHYVLEDSRDEVISEIGSFLCH